MERNTSKEYINGHKACLYFNHVCSVTNQINYNYDYDVIFDKRIKYLYLYIHNWMNMCATVKNKLLHHETIHTITNDHCSNGQQDKSNRINYTEYSLCLLESLLCIEIKTIFRGNIYESEPVEDN